MFGSIGIGFLFGMKVKELERKNAANRSKTDDGRRNGMPSSEDKRPSASGVSKPG